MMQSSKSKLCNIQMCTKLYVSFNSHIVSRNTNVSYKQFSIKIFQTVHAIMCEVSSAVQKIYMLFALNVCAHMCLSLLYIVTTFLFSFNPLTLMPVPMHYILSYIICNKYVSRYSLNNC